MSSPSRGGLIGRLADEFDLAWRQQPPDAAEDIREHFRGLLAADASVLDASGRATLLDELIKLDLEFRWRSTAAGRAKWHVRDYVGQFPELKDGPRTVPLLAEEYRVRWQWGDRPARPRFVQDHPDLEPHLTPLLIAVEKSLGVTVPPPPVRSVVYVPSVAASTPFLPSIEPPKSSRTAPYEPATDMTPPSRPTTPERPPATAAWPKIPGYDITKELGHGGMGVVYQAWDTGLKRLVALKLILGRARTGDAGVVRFRKEAQALAKLKHPGIVQIFEYGEHEGQPYFALEFVAGGSLSDYMRGTPQPPSAAAVIVETLARAMAAAHEAGVVHRDLKPANVLLELPPIDKPAKGKPARRANLATARPKITDFGLAKQLDDVGEQTQTGAVMGTPQYMAPEQTTGRTEDVGPLADVYALGAILYAMLVGRPPFEGPTPIDTMNLVRSRDPVSPRLLQPTVPLDLETICLKCLRKEPDKRYESATDLADDLKRFTAGEPILARPVGPVEQAWKFYRRNPRLVLGGVAIAALLMLSTVTSVFAAISSSAKAKAETDKLNAETAKGKADRERDAAVIRQNEIALESERAERKNVQKIQSQDKDLRIGVAERELSSPHGDVALAENILDGYLGNRGWEWRYLVRKCDGDREPLTGHTAGVWSVAHHPKMDEVATASIDGTVRLWDVKTGATTAIFEGHRGGVQQLANATKTLTAVQKAPVLKNARAPAEAMMGLMTGGFRMAESVSGVKAPEIVNKGVNVVASGGTLPEVLTPVLRVAYSPDGEYVASGALELNTSNLQRVAAGTEKPNPIATVRIWKRSDPSQTVRTFTEHQVIITALAFSPDGRLVASAGMDDDHSWKLWDRDTGKVLHNPKGHKSWLCQARFSPDGKTVATGSSDGTAILWDVATGQGRPLPAYQATVYDVAFSANGQFLATAGLDGRVLIWTLADLSAKPVELRGHIGAALGVSFSPDGLRVASAGYDRTVRVWDPGTGAEKVTLRGHTDIVWGVDFSHDGQRLVSGSFDRTARIWDASPVVPQSFPGAFTVRNEPEQKDEDHRINRLAFSSDGLRMATASWDRTAGLWDATSGKKLFDLPHEGPVWGVAFNPAGDRLLTGSWDTTVRLWDATTGQEMKRFAGAPSPVQSVAYSRDGKLVAAGYWDGKVQVWDAATGQPQSRCAAKHNLPVYSLAFSPDGRYLATASGDRTAKLWPLDGGDGRLIRQHDATVFAVAFDPDGRRVATASWDNTFSVSRYQSGSATLQYVVDAAKGGHTDCMYGVAFSPDGRQIATVSHDKTLRCWDADTGAQVGGPRGLHGVAWDVAYHPDGRQATAVWNPKGWVRIWPPIR